MQPPVATEPDYYVRLGLTADPFAANAMPEFFFVGAQRRFIAQRAVHALYFSGTTVLLLGSHGSGKTRTLVEIEKELKDLADICRIDATVLMNAAEIRGLLADTLGVPTSAAIGNPELVYALDRMRPADSDPQPILIAIDAAHHLSIETLIEIAALVASAGGRLRLLLSGEADLFTAWEQAQVGAAEVLELKPLSRAETEDYVRTKIQAAGYLENRLLSDEDVDRLFAESGGNFAAINAFVPRLLLPKAESSSVVERVRSLPLVHIVIATVVLAVVILLMLYRGDESTSSQTQTAQPTATKSTIAGDKNNAERKSIALQLPTPNTSPINTVKPEEKSAPAIAAVTATNKVAEKPSATDTKNTPEKPVVAKKETPSASETESTVIANKTPSLNADERALLAMPSSNYVLQLLGAESKTTVDKFAKGAGKGVKLYAYRTRLRGKPWFIVVTGPYADKRAVQAGLEKLPDAVRKQQPWPRSLVNVQADIRAYSGG